MHLEDDWEKSGGKRAIQADKRHNGWPSDDIRKSRKQQRIDIVKGEVELIKEECEEFQTPFHISSRKLATRLGFSRTSVNKYLREIYGKWYRLGTRGVRKLKTWSRSYAVYCQIQKYSNNFVYHFEF